MPEIDFMSALHNQAKRDHLMRVNDPDFPKDKAAELYKQWGYEYWDGDRRICYGGYRYMPGRWAPVAKREIERVGEQHKYVCVESYRNETEKMNLLYWQVTCEAFCTPKEWLWWFKQTGYTGDYSFIYFE